ncbi:hypothetical protein BpHYR1_052250 [Brachionus plicatilis]|uniref:Uncharacterized protein n=1 Tax=Brachionus plicatilis TaxID=10195 RepID=A0A3M7TBX8_BRAPC|nr:hypothetical protein BpHYR1_052250 [Brachionus plicatilis]
MSDLAKIGSMFKNFFCINFESDLTEPGNGLNYARHSEFSPNHYFSLKFNQIREKNGYCHL